MNNEKKKESFKSSDIYQSAYLLAIGSTVKGLEVVKELDKDVCIITFSGENIQSKLKEYSENKALVNPLIYQKAINRVKDIMFRAITKAKKGGDV